MKRKHFTWLTLIFGAALAALFGLLINMLPYSVISDRLNFLTPDGNLESLTLEAFSALRLVLGILGGIGFVILLSLVSRKNKSQIWIGKQFEKLKVFWQIYREDAASFWQSSKRFFPRSSETKLLALIVIIGAVLRVILLDRPMLHDESYTYIAFASRDLFSLISDYHLPNNHVFHTLLVYFSERLLGFGPWVVRFPAFMAGVIIIPAVYVAGRMAFNNLAGLLAAALIAFSSYFIYFSTQARGYSLIALIAVVLWILSIQLARERNIFTWSLFAIFAALGFFTIPIMIYPYAAIMVWLGAMRLAGDIKDKYAANQFWKDYVSSAAVTAFLTLLLYTPILIRSGVNSLLNNPFISKKFDPEFDELAENLFTRWGKVWESWNEGALPTLMIAGALFFLLALIFHKRNSKLKIAFPVLGLLVILAMIILQRTVGVDRVWGFGLPFYLIYLGGGISIITDIIKRTRYGTSLKIVFPAIIIGLFAFSSISLISGKNVIWQERRGAQGEVERATEYLDQLIDDESMIIVTSPDAPIFKYYAKVMNIPSQLFDTSRTDASNFSVVINTQSKQTIEDVLNAHEALNLDNKFQEAELIYSSRRIEIYYFDNQ